MSETERRYGGESTFLSMLAILFIALKLTGVIHWSWWWILAPIWGSVALVLAVIGVLLGIAALVATFGKGKT